MSIDIQEKYIEKVKRDKRVQLVTDEMTYNKVKEIARDRYNSVNEVINVMINAYYDEYKTWKEKNRTFGYISGDKIPTGAYIYFITDGMDSVKIGIAQDVKKRIDALQTSNPNKLNLLYALKVDNKQDAQEIEKELHGMFARDRKQGEWFKSENVIEFLKKDKFILGHYMFEGINAELLDAR